MEFLEEGSFKYRATLEHPNLQSTPQAKKLEMCAETITQGYHYKLAQAGEFPEFSATMLNN